MSKLTNQRQAMALPNPACLSPYTPVKTHIWKSGPFPSQIQNVQHVITLDALMTDCILDPRCWTKNRSGFNGGPHCPGAEYEAGSCAVVK